MNNRSTDNNAINLSLGFVLFSIIILLLCLGVPSKGISAVATPTDISDLPAATPTDLGGIPITCSFSLPDGNAEIGKPYTFSYEISGGSGYYKDVYLIIEYMTGEIDYGTILSQEFTDSLQGSSAICTLIPREGNVLGLGIGGTDVFTGDSFSDWLGTNILIDQNSQYPVSFSFDKEYYDIGEVISLNYNVEGLSELSNAQIWCCIDSQTSFGNLYNGVQDVTSAHGTYSFTPGYGYALYAVLEAKDSEGKPIYAQSNRIRFDTISLEPITCSFTLPEGNAQIGKPYTFSYAISGGSGSYKNTTVQVESTAKWGRVLDNGNLYSINNPSGTYTFIPTVGYDMRILVRGYDALTNEPFGISCDSNIYIDPNDQYPVSFIFDKDQYEPGETIQIHYSVGNISKFRYARIWCYISSSQINDAYCGTQVVTATTGVYSYTPLFGRRLYAVLEAEDDVGNPIYAESAEVIIGNNIPIICEFSLPEDKPEIGKPYTFSYEISGGSGSYKDLYVNIYYYTDIERDVFDELDLFNDSIDLDSAIGSVTFTPKIGTFAGINIYGHDSVTGDYFVFGPDDGLQEIKPNSSFNITLSYSRTDYGIGDTITLNYTINGVQSIRNTKIGWISATKSRAEIMLDAQPIQTTSDTYSFMPHYWECIYAVLQGEDQDGNPFYIESNHLNLGSILSDKVLILPSSIEIIESQAFAGVAATAIVIPDSVKFIADNAFTDSEIRTIIADTQYSSRYALTHGLGYAQRKNVAEK